VRDKTLRWAAIHGDGDESLYQTALALSGTAWVRVRLGAGGSVQVKRITDPTEPAQWLAWSTLRAAGGVNDVAVAADGDLVRTFAIISDAGGFSVLVWASTDGGASWSGPATVAQSASGITSLASATPATVAYVLDGVLHVAEWGGAAWGDVATWAAGAVTADYGIAAAERDGALYFLVAGELADGAYLRTVSWDGVDWSDAGTLVPTGVPAATLIPRWPSLVWTGDRWLACYLDTFAGSVTYQTPTIRFSPDFDHWSYPCALSLNSQGATRANLLVEPGRMVAAMEVSALAAKRYSAADPAMNLAEYASVLHAEITMGASGESRGRLSAHLYDDGTLVDAPLRPYAEAVLHLGYATSAGMESVALPPFYLTEVRRVRNPSQPGTGYVLTAEDGWGLLAASQAVTAHVWTDVTLGWALAEVLMRFAGLSLATDGHPVWDMTLERFAVMQGSRADSAVRALLRRAGARAGWTVDGSLYAFVAVAQSWANDWTFDVEVLEAEYGVAAAGVTLARVAGEYPALGQAQDVHAGQAQGRTLGAVLTDAYLTTNIACADAAAAIVEQGVAAGLRDTLTGAIVPGLEPLDQVTVNDASMGIVEALRRVTSIRTVCDPIRGVWEQKVELEGNE
jgi:hypothetical protein